MAFRSGDVIAIVTIAGGALLGARLLFGGESDAHAFRVPNVAVERIEADVRHRVQVRDRADWEEELERGLAELERALEELENLDEIEGLESLQGLEQLEQLEQLGQLKQLEQLQRLESYDFAFDFDFDFDFDFELDDVEVVIDGVEVKVDTRQEGSGN